MKSFLLISDEITSIRTDLAEYIYNNNLLSYRNLKVATLVAAYISTYFSLTLLEEVTLQCRNQ